jgi:hypothetical protein
MAVRQEVLIASTGMASSKTSDAPYTKPPRVNTRVRFQPSPASLGLYTHAPNVGEEGMVRPVAMGGGKKKTFMAGPGGGLLYVEWDQSGFIGVSLYDVRPAASQRATIGGPNKPLVPAFGSTQGLLAVSRMKRIGEKMHHWHASMGDPIYAVGSFYVTGKAHPSVETTERALDGIERDLDQPRSAEDRDELEEIATFLRAQLGKERHAHHEPQTDREHGALEGEEDAREFNPTARARRGNPETSMHGHHHHHGHHHRHHHACTCHECLPPAKHEGCGCGPAPHAEKHHPECGCALCSKGRLGNPVGRRKKPLPRASSMPLRPGGGGFKFAPRESAPSAQYPAIGGKRPRPPAHACLLKPGDRVEVDTKGWPRDRGEVAQVDGQNVGVYFETGEYAGDLADFECGMLVKRMHNPTKRKKAISVKGPFVIRQGSLTHHRYLGADGSWSGTPKTFSSQAKADAFARAHVGGENWGIFPASLMARKPNPGRTLWKAGQAAPAGGYGPPPLPEAPSGPKPWSVFDADGTNVGSVTTEAAAGRLAKAFMTQGGWNPPYTVGPTHRKANPTKRPVKGKKAASKKASPKKGKRDQSVQQVLRPIAKAALGGKACYQPKCFPVKPAAHAALAGRAPLALPPRSR